MILWLAMTLCLGVEAPSPPETPVPAKILQHYDDHNFAVAFSTPVEREQLAQQPTTTADPRLLEVDRRLRRLEGQVDHVDPAMAVGASRRGPSRSDLLVVKSTRIDPKRGEAWVELEAITIRPEINTFLVSRYESLGAGGRTPKADDVRPGGGPVAVATVIHTWREVDGEWRREGATRYLLAQ